MCFVIPSNSPARQLAIRAILIVWVVVCASGCGRSQKVKPQKSALESSPPRTVRVYSAPSPLGQDHRLLAAGGDWNLSQGDRVLPVPAAVAAFDDWLEKYVSAPVDSRTALETEGLRLLSDRRQAIAEMITSDPEAAILLTPTHVQRAMLPPKLRDSLEQIVSGEGFYGVKALCNHDPGAGHETGCRIEHEVLLDRRSYQATIYGTRAKRLTEESASIYGVALDGVLALHQDDVVVLPAGAVEAQAPSDQLALIFRGKTTLVSAADIEARIRSLLQP